MAQLVQLRNNILLLIMISLSGCNAPVERVPASYSLVNRANADMKFVNGLLQVNHKIFTGLIFTLYPNNRDTAEINEFYEGREDGEWKKYYENGKLKEKRNFTAGKKTGDYYAWWGNGRLQLHYIFVNDEYDGNCLEWNENGLLTKDMNYRRSREDGLQRWWYDNGKIKANYIIREGRRYGLLGTKNCINVSDSIFKK